ncbi:MAG: hypothetical protein ROM54_06710 [Anaerobiospirillum sp.]|nr:hypothetical protein [Anaerobiospirillum sp.]
MKSTTSDCPAGSDYFFILRLIPWVLLVFFYFVMAALIGVDCGESNAVLLDPLVEQFSIFLGCSDGLAPLELDELFFSPWIAWGQMTVLFMLGIPYGALMGVFEGQVDTVFKRNKASAGSAPIAWYVVLCWFLAPWVACLALEDHRFLVLSGPWLAFTGYSLAFSITYAAACHLTHLAVTTSVHA